MSKKIIALSTMLLSVLLVLITVETVTGRGILNAQCTFYETISPFGKYFNLELGDKITLEWLKITIFIVGTLLLFAPNFLLFEQSKKRSITLMIVNIIGMVLEFLFSQFYLYMFMLIIWCILLTCNILIQFIQGIKNKVDMFVLIITIFIGMVNSYYLYYHFKRHSLWEMWSTSDKLINEMIHISRINMICLALWFIPYGILLVKEIKGNGNKFVKS